jgi:hypothetical protein
VLSAWLTGREESAVHESIQKYNAAQSASARAICDALAEAIDAGLEAAEARFTDRDQIKPSDLKRWLKKSRTIQWDYKNIVKRRGVLEKLRDR